MFHADQCCVQYSFVLGTVSLVLGVMAKECSEPHQTLLKIHLFSHTNVVLNFFKKGKKIKLVQ